jgi:DNA-binding response OmpR family regulator
VARILLVEDEADVRQVMRHALFDGGYEVDVADTQHGGFSLLVTGGYDLVIADGRLPDGSGLELAAVARARNVPVLIITGYAFSLPKEALDQCRLLLKPVRPNELLQAVEEVLQRQKT